MPSSPHEALLQLFRERPRLAAEMLVDGLGVALPDFEAARVESGEYSDVAPTEYRADAVVSLTVADRPVLAVVVESQLRPDHRKRRSWPVYVCTLRARLDCPVMLLVVCGDTPTAAWCETPIELGHPGFVLRPLVLGPDRVPRVTDPDQAVRVPEAAVLSAMAHGAGPGRDQVFAALLRAFDVIDRQRRALYYDYVIDALPSAVARHLEELMRTSAYEYRSEFARTYFSQGKAEGEARGMAEGEARGKAEGEARAVLTVLEARSIDVPSDVRDRITSCTDLDQLDRWVRRAVTAEKASELFD